MRSVATRTFRRQLGGAKWSCLLCTKTCEVENRAQVIALNGIGIKGMAEIILSRQPIPFLDEMCTQNGIVGEPVIFQTADDKKAKKSSIVGAGATPGEQGLRWIIVLDIYFKDLFVLLTCCACFSAENLSY